MIAFLMRRVMSDKENKPKSGHSIRVGFAMTLNQKMEKMREKGYTFSRTKNGIIVNTPKEK